MFGTERTKFDDLQPSKWVASLGEAYMTAMTPVIRDYLLATRGKEGRAERYLATPKGQWQLQQQVFGRMQICRNQMMPWVAQACEFTGKRILEIGCGTGSATGPLALSAEHVSSLDINLRAMVCARERMALLGVSNVRFIEATPEWIDRFDADIRPQISGSVDMVIANAVLEHLLPVERIKFLQLAWRVLSPGGHLVIVETPNRLHFWDWHSSKMFFSDVLPDDLAFLYNRYSTRRDMPAGIIAQDVEDLKRCSKTALYRFGRGASFHEFALAIGLENMDVVADSYSPKAIRRSAGANHDEQWDAAVRHLFERFLPAVSRGFAAASLDLVIRKIRDTAPPPAAAEGETPKA